VRLLLDTHAAIWLLSSDARISEDAVDHFAEETNEVLLSATSVFEIAVKRALGKLEAPTDLVEQMEVVGVRMLPITIEHAAAVEDLPPHHRDPFDRLLVAQATVERAAILSADPALRRYDVNVLW
jgi:PIN domain nuclease of toxin-antitoxin system